MRSCTIYNEAPKAMKYNLARLSETGENTSMFSTFKALFELISDEKKKLSLAVFATLTNSFINLGSPFLIGYVIDQYITNKQFNSILFFAGLLMTLYLIALRASYFQTKLTGQIGQNLLFALRNKIFNKMQELPIAFFNANKAGNLIYRINSDTEKLNIFFSDSLTQFVGCIATIIGAAFFLLIINFKMGLAALLPSIIILIFSRSISSFVNKRNAISLESEADMSAEIHEMLNNFKVIVAFNKRDYLKKRFSEVNKKNYKNALVTGVVTNAVFPVYNLSANIAQVILLIVGIFLMKLNELSIGFLISYLLNVTNFYNPLKMLAQVWTQVKGSTAALDRINQILSLNTDMTHLENSAVNPISSVVELKNVCFDYGNGKEVLHNVSLKLEKGKKYAFVGPTGGGKTTMALLLARLYDPTRGNIWIDSKDIRAYTPEERTQKIGFILQDPFIFTGTVRENIIYGNTRYDDCTDIKLLQVISDANLQDLLLFFDNGLETEISGDNISIGQKQLISFIRTFLRNPDILILDEASANIDTVTEQLLEQVLRNLPETTTCIIIAHRLNTIENADEIFFVNAGEVSHSVSMEYAINRLLNEKRVS